VERWPELVQSLQALVASASSQPELFPDLEPSADKLAADFDHAWREARVTTTRLTKAQRRCLAAVSEQLAAMAEARELWSTAALRTSAAWTRVRELAAQALTELEGELPVAG